MAIVVAILAAAPAMAASNVDVGSNGALSYDAAVGADESVCHHRRRRIADRHRHRNRLDQVGQGCTIRGCPDGDLRSAPHSIAVTVRDLDDTVTLTTELIR